MTAAKADRDGLSDTGNKAQWGMSERPFNMTIYQTSDKMAPMISPAEPFLGGAVGWVVPDCTVFNQQFFSHGKTARQKGKMHQMWPLFQGKKTSESTPEQVM